MSFKKSASNLNIPRVLIYAPALAALAGCSIVPGPYLGVVPTASEKDTPYTYDISGTEDVASRADIYSITPETVSKQIGARNTVEANIEKSKVLASTQLNAPYQYLVGAQDVLNITVWNHPEINNPAGTLNASLAGRVVNGDGKFFFPYAGNVQAEGRTVQQIRDDLTVKLARVLVEPQVDVSVLTYRSRRAFVVGEIAHPGVVPITDVPLTVTDLISQGGGLNPDADLRAATLMRNGKSLPVDLYSLYYAGDFSQNYRLESGDILTIPENRYNKIFVLGEVGKPQSIVMPRGRISLAEAISDSGGFNPLTANAGQVYVIREGSTAKPQIWHLDASSPDALILADRFDLQARDVVYVDPAEIARFGRVVSNIVPTAAVLRATVQN